MQTPLLGRGTLGGDASSYIAVNLVVVSAFTLTQTAHDHVATLLGVAVILGADKPAAAKVSPTEMLELVKASSI